MTSNRKIIDMIREFASLHELTGQTFKLRSYQKAVKVLLGVEEDLADMSQSDLMKIDGVGKSIASKIREFVDTGTVASLEKLQSETPPGLRDVMSIDGVGPKTAKMLYETLDIDSVDKLEEAINNNKLDGIKGIGSKTLENMLDGIDRFRRSSGRSLRANVQPIADEIVAKLKNEFSSITDASVAGSLRRKRATIGDVDILVQSHQNLEIMEYFTNMEDVARVLASGDRKSSIILDNDLQIDLRVIEGSSFYAHLQYFTGSKDHNIRVRGLAIDQGYRLNEYGLFKNEEPTPLASEATIYETLGLEYVIPELREDRGEIEAASSRKLPDLISLSDVKSDFHVHSKPDDPSLRNLTNTMEDMIQAAIKYGHEYIVFTDHTIDLSMVGYDDDGILEQLNKARELNNKYNDIEIFMGAELNIREDGSVDLKDDTLDQLDFAIASIHSYFKMEEKEMTSRLMTAMENDNINAIGHPTTREFGKRDPIPIDFDKLVNQAIDTHTALEINGAPSRMDLDDAIIHRFHNTELKFTLGSDAHHTYQFNNIEYSVDLARRGWLNKDQILNTLSLNEFKKHIS